MQLDNYIDDLRKDDSFKDLNNLVCASRNLGVSRSKEIQFEICSSLHIWNRMCFELSPFLGQSEDVLMWLVSMLYYDSR